MIDSPENIVAYGELVLQQWYAADKSGDNPQESREAWNLWLNFATNWGLQLLGLARQALTNNPRIQSMLPLALQVMEAVLAQGAKDHPPHDWRKLGVEGNLLHAQEHQEEYERLELDEDLDHDLVRRAMAVQLREEGKVNTED